MSYNIISNKLETYSFHQKNSFSTQTFDEEKIKTDKGRTSCFCISQSITPKNLYLISQFALGILCQTSWGETSSGTHLSPQLKASTCWSHKSRGPQNSTAHSTSFRTHHCWQPGFHPCCHPTPQPTMLHGPSVEPCTKDEPKRKEQTSTTLPSYQEREESGPCAGVLCAGRGEAAPDWGWQATLLQLAEQLSTLTLSREKASLSYPPTNAPSPPSQEGRTYLHTVICININPSRASEDTWWDPIQFCCYRFCKERHAQHPNTANLSHGARGDCRPMQWAVVNFRSSLNKDSI